MYCKYCGKPIDQGTMRCKVCGRPVGPLEGGNSFWDLTGEQPAPAVPAAQEDPAIPKLEKQIEELRAELASRRAPRRGGGAFLAALLALAALAVGGYGFYQTKLLSGQIEENAARISRLSQEQETQAALIEEAQKPIQAIYFIQQPTDAAPELNAAIQDEYTQNGVWLFEAAFEGNYGPYLSYWEKVEGDPADPEYIPVSQLEGDLFREITVTAREGSRTSRLYSNGPIRREHDGIYVFTVEDYEHNLYHSEPVRLTVMKNGKPVFSNAGNAEAEQSEPEAEAQTEAEADGRTP